MGIMSELDIERQNYVKELSALPDYKLVSRYLQYYELHLKIKPDIDRFFVIMAEIDKNGCRDAIIRLTANWYIAEKMKEVGLWEPLC